MKNQIRFTRIIRTHLSASFFAVLILLSACSKVDPKDIRTEPDPNPYLTLGFYQSTDVYNDNPTTYRMLVRTNGDHEDQFVISNFADLKADVLAHWDGSGIVLSEQNLTIDTYHRLVILYGSITSTDQGVKISYETQEGSARKTNVIHAIYAGK